MTHVHIDIVAFERALRESFNAQTPDGATDYMLIQERTNETQIQFAVWVMSEVNRGTSADDIIGAASIVVGNMIGNMANQFSGPVAEMMIDHVTEMVAKFSEPDDENTSTRFAHTYQSEGGNA